MDCVFARRRTQLVKLPTVAELFATASRAYTGYSQGANYVNSSSQDYVQYATGSMSSTMGVIYALALFNGYLGIWKYDTTKSGSQRWTQTPIFQSNSSYCGVLNSSSYSSEVMYNGGYATSGTAAMVNQGATLFIKFSDTYDTATIEAVLSSMTASRLAYRNSYSQSTVRTNNKTNQIYLVAKAGVEWWSCDGSTWTKMGGTTNNDASVSSGYLTLGNTYGGSIIGLT